MKPLSVPRAPFAPRAPSLLGLGALAVAFSAVGCSGAAPGAGGETVSDNTSAIAPLTAFANDQTAFDYFVAKGLTNFQAAGIVGNLDQESGVDPNAVQSGGPGRGIAQWSVGGRWDTDANDNAVAYASQHGASVYALTLQLDFIWYELTTLSGYGLAALKASTNVTDATVAFQNDFEGCGTCDQTTRVSYAQSVLAAYGSIPYGAAWVSQSFPLASTTLTMTAGEVLPSYIELKNTGTKAWDANTHLGTTQPRDRKSAFADATWLMPDRPAGVKGTVAPGATYKFTFNLTAPSTPGTYDEFFGVVEEGVAWFSDPGQGGPPDSDLEVKIQVVAAKPGADAGTPHAGDAGAHGGDGGTPSGTDAGVTVDDAGNPAPPGPGPSDDAGALEGADGGGGTWNGSSAGPSGGCSIGPSPGRGGDAPRWIGALGLLGLLAGLRGARSRRRRPERAGAQA